MAKKPKFEEDCEIPFRVTWRYSLGKAKSCGVAIKLGHMRECALSYVPVPATVRFGHAPFTRYFKTEEGQDVLRMELQKHGVSL